MLLVIEDGSGDGQVYRAAAWLTVLYVATGKRRYFVRWLGDKVVGSLATTAACARSGLTVLIFTGCSTGAGSEVKTTI
jgi:hypothetical protein